MKWRNVYFNFGSINGILEGAAIYFDVYNRDISTCFPQKLA